MILHCSRKLAAHLPAVSRRTLAEVSPLGSWHANLYTIDRRQCLLFCHDDTRYGLFLPGVRKAQFEQLGRWHRALLLGALAAQGLAEGQLKRVELALGPASFDQVTERSPMGTLRVMRQDLEGPLHDVGHVLELDPVWVAVWLNKRPCTVRGRWVQPCEAMAERIAALP